jgi:MFS family permease
MPLAKIHVLEGRYDQSRMAKVSAAIQAASCPPRTLLAATLARRNVHYGWVVVGVTFLTLLVTAAAMGMPGVLIVPLEKEFGWDNAQISSALAIRIMLFGLFGPFAAAFMNRFGVRRVIMFAMALIAGGLLASLAMTQVWQLILLWGIVVGVGTGLTAWFWRRQWRPAGSTIAVAS